jgi:NADH-ubiquinone oxidoreductase chain 5
MSGFYSKDIILEVGFSKYIFIQFFLYWLTIITIFFTSFYSIRLMYFTFFNNCNLHLNVSKRIHESDYFIKIVLIVLTVISLYIGYLAKDLFIGLGTDIWQNSIIMLSDSFLIAEFIHIKIKLIPLVFSCFGIIGSLLFYTIINKKTRFYNNIWYNLIFKFFNQKWYFDLVYNNFIIRPILLFSYKITFKLIDRGVIEYFGSFGVINLISKISYHISKFQSGYIYHYIFVIILSLIFFLLIIYYVKIKILTFILIGIIFFLLVIK